MKKKLNQNALTPRTNTLLKKKQRKSLLLKLLFFEIIAIRRNQACNEFGKIFLTQEVHKLYFVIITNATINGNGSKLILIILNVYLF